MSSPSRSILSSLFGSRSNDNNAPQTPDGLQIGDRFYKVGRWESIWIVQRLFKPDGNSSLHAKIVRDGHPGDVTIIRRRSFSTTRSTSRTAARGKSMTSGRPLVAETTIRVSAASRSSSPRWNPRVGFAIGIAIR